VGSTVLEELLHYVQMSDDDVGRLAAAHPLLQPSFLAIAEKFYEAVWADPSTAAVLSGPEQIERLRRTLVDWMSTGLLGPYDERFYEKRSRIGRRHVQIGLPHQYMFTAMNVVRTAYADHLQRLLPPTEALATLRAVHKLLDVELAIMVRHYQLDSEEKLIARERRMQIDRISAMQTMTAGLAHEVRNPLNAAKLQLELLDRRLRRESKDERLLQPSTLASVEIQRLTELLNDFLAFARPAELQLEDREIGDIVRRVYELELPNAAKRGIALTLEAAGESTLARIDPGKLQQIVDNLVRNAVEAVRAGGHVTMQVTAETDIVSIIVQDDGPGIPAELHGRIYEPFFTTKDEGTGLGMSIVHSLVALHDGAIALDSSAAGTRFVVSLPRRR
jgi:two-component system sensor histidine kinase HydH